jgi:hypothetical protein
MALVAANSTLEPRSFSIGPIQILNLTAQNGDTSGTITADALSSVGQVIVAGLDLTAAATMSGNAVTLAFADPLAARSAQIICLGK